MCYSRCGPRSQTKGHPGKEMGGGRGLPVRLAGVVRASRKSPFLGVQSGHFRKCPERAKGVGGRGRCSGSPRVNLGGGRCRQRAVGDSGSYRHSSPHPAGDGSPQQAPGSRGHPGVRPGGRDRVKVPGWKLEPRRRFRGGRAVASPRLLLPASNL